MRLRRWTAALLLALAQPLAAQDAAPQPVVRSQILILDYETLFARSDFGRRVAEQIQAEGRALIEENARIEAELTAEELLLTTQRDDLTPEEFRALADAFDEKVQRIRTEQDTKARQVGQGREEEEARFRRLVTPIIGRIMQETGAGVVLDRSQAVVWADALDITQAVLNQVNRVLGAGPETPAPTAEVGEIETPDAPTPTDNAPETETPTPETGGE